MSRWTLLLLVIFLVNCVACAKKGGEAQASTKPLFSVWHDNGGTTLDLSELAFGESDAHLAMQNVGTCDIHVVATGSETSGTIVISNPVFAPIDQNTFSTYCADLAGSYEFYRSPGGLVFGEQDGRMIEYH